MGSAGDSMGSYAAPPRPRDEDGHVRRVGLEVELGGLSLERALGVIRDVLGGSSEVDSRTVGLARDTAQGDFKVELDSKPLQQRTYLRSLEELGIELEPATADTIEDSVLQVAREVVPLEIVAPPIPWDHLYELDRLWSELRRAGAEDTYSGLLHAFGLHLNPQIATRDVAWVRDVLRAFLLLEEALAEAMDVDLSRRVAPYIRAFPEEYRGKVADPRYAPDWDGLIADYVQFNPTRNRPLDMLPLFAEVRQVELEGKVQDWDHVRPRPAFHYRLPNSAIAQPGWSPAVEWNRWLLVERLADSPDLLAELGASYVETPSWRRRLARATWVEHVRPYLRELDG